MDQQLGEFVCIRRCNADFLHVPGRQKNPVNYSSETDFNLDRIHFLDYCLVTEALHHPNYATVSISHFFFFMSWHCCSSSNLEKIYNAYKCVAHINGDDCFQPFVINYLFIKRSTAPLTPYRLPEFWAYLSFAIALDVSGTDTLVNLCASPVVYGKVALFIHFGSALATD